MVAQPLAYRSKRFLDIVLVLGLSTPALAIVALCAIIISIEARANPFFIQTRVGLGRRHFRLFKLRTMPSQTADLPSHEVGAQAILKTGKFLRGTKIDELPQLWNVLNGTMSFVGPRPCLPIQEELISKRAAQGVYDLIPGITGPAQLAGIDMSTPTELAYADAVYRTDQSLSGDLGILLRTVTGKGSGDAARR